MSDRIQALRRFQIKSVAIGSAGGLMFLVGLAFEKFLVARIGLALFLLALATVFVLGGALVVVQQNTKPE